MKKSVSFVLSLAMLFGCFCMGGASIASAENESRYSAAVPYGGIIQDYVSEIVYYSRKDTSEKFVNQYELPHYYARNMDNCCAITAGGVIMANFDRTYEELIPNHTTFEFLGQVVYSEQDAAVDSMFQELYQRMGTTSAGTTVEGYKKGMTSYVQSKGRSIEITSIYKNSSLNESAYIAALKAGKLLTIFMDGFCIVGLAGINTNDGYDKISGTVVTGLHIVAAYGYRIVRYYDASNKLIQEDKYLYVNTGFGSAGLAMIRLNKYITVDDGYAINIT